MENRQLVQTAGGGLMMMNFQTVPQFPTVQPSERGRQVMDLSIPSISWGTRFQGPQEIAYSESSTVSLYGQAAFKHDNMASMSTASLGDRPKFEDEQMSEGDAEDQTSSALPQIAGPSGIQTRPPLKRAAQTVEPNKQFKRNKP